MDRVASAVGGNTLSFNRAHENLSRDKLDPRMVSVIRAGHQEASALNSRRYLSSARDDTDGWVKLVLHSR